MLGTSSIEGAKVEIVSFQVLERIAPPSKKLVKDGFDFSPWFKPEGYATDF